MFSSDQCSTINHLTTLQALMLTTHNPRPRKRFGRLLNGMLLIHHRFVLQRLQRKVFGGHVKLICPKECARKISTFHFIQSNCYGPQWLYANININDNAGAQAFQTMCPLCLIQNSIKNDKGHSQCPTKSPLQHCLEQQPAQGTKVLFIDTVRDELTVQCTFG